MFHVLRRQMVRPFRKPLIIMSPKSMLRHKESVSTLEELADGRFQPVIAETDDIDAAEVRRVIFCSGKIYYDLRAARRERGIKDIAIVRLEQLYPFPHDEYIAQIQQVRGGQSRSCGARKNPAIRAHGIAFSITCCATCSRTRSLAYALRTSSASPAVGYLALHLEQLKAVIDAALTIAA